MKAMVLGAGVGTRLEPITNFIPKPLVPVANRPVVDHIVDLLQKHGFTQLTCNVHYLADKMQEHFASKKDVEVTLRYEEQLTGDAGGVRACRQFLDDDTFIVIMGDLLTDADLSKILEEHKRKKAVATIAVKSIEDVSRFGVVVRDSEGFITDFQEKPSKQEARSNQISTGIYMLEPEVFNHIPQTGMYGFGRQLFPLLVERGCPVLGVELTDYWTDIGTLGDYLRANCDAINGLVAVPVKGQKTDFGWIAPDADLDDTCKIEGRLILDSHSKVGRSVRITGSVAIGAGATIADNCSLEDCVIFPGEHVAARSVISRSVVAYGKIVSCASVAKVV